MLNVKASVFLSLETEIHHICQFLYGCVSPQINKQVSCGRIKQVAETSVENNEWMPCHVLFPVHVFEDLAQMRKR